jgi:hypothetical protein
MPGFFASLMGVPATEAQVRAEVAKFVKTRDVHMMREVMSDNLAHMTSKSGALLQAQGIFIAVATYLLSQGWPRVLALVSIFLLTIAALAVMTKTEVLLLITGGIFVIEALSVLIQVVAFQRFRRRVFLMAPVHHHFELMAWSETKIILRFWIIAAVCAAIGFTIYQQSIA